jgi:allophanate hydrolase subunit 2
LTVERVRGLVTVQDLGRRGHMHEAVPPGGALVPELLVAANRAARNPDDAPALEVFGELVVRAETGETRALTSEPARVAYLAVRGGVAAPLVLDGRGTLLAAHLGRALRAGDRVELAGLPEVVSRPPPPLARGPIRVVPGPDREAFAPDALDVLCAESYAIAPASDRVGTRLTGAAIRRQSIYRERSRPMVRGAIEVPGDGAPIVLGPDHPTTGGYPVLAVIAERDLGSLFAIRIGGMVRFVR